MLKNPTGVRRIGYFYSSKVNQQVFFRHNHQLFTKFERQLLGCKQSKTNEFKNEDDRKMKIKQDRLINANYLLEKLRSQVPELLQQSLSLELISKSVILRICPHTHPYIPVIKGQYGYFAAHKAIRMVVTNFLLNANVKLHILSINIQEPSHEVNSDKLGQKGFEQQLIDAIPIFNESLLNFPKSKSNGVFDWTYKIVVKWRTCTEDCEHLVTGGSKYHDTTEANLGSYNITKFDESIYKKIKFSDLNNTVNGIFTAKSNEESGQVSGYSSGERVISGIFVFELTLDNKKILVQSLEDVEIVEKKDSKSELSLLGA